MQIVMAHKSDDKTLVWFNRERFIDAVAHTDGDYLVRYEGGKGVAVSCLIPSDRFCRIFQTHQ